MSSLPGRRIEVQEIGDVTVIRWDDQPQWPSVLEPVFKGVEESKRRKFLVNFAKVESLSSIVLAKLMILNKKLQPLSGVVTLCNVSPRVREVFEITRVSEFFGFQPGEQEALQELAKPTAVS